MEVKGAPLQAISESTRTVLALSRLPGIGAAWLRDLNSRAAEGGPDLEAGAARCPAVSRALEAPGAWEAAMDAAACQIQQAVRLGARIVSRWDADYPSLLAASGEGPGLLFVRGAWAANPVNTVAIVGTRQPTADGAVITARLTAQCVEQGWSIVSGLALGCDAVAHRTALRDHGHTVAVLAQGLDTVYPKQHHALAEAIVDRGGALVSEFPFGCAPRPRQFVQRDRTQARLAGGVVLIQSDLTGGSLHAARAALAYDRWLAVPVPTARDRWGAAPTVRANGLVADGSTAEKTRLLHCTAAALDRLVILRGRNDYAQMRQVPVERASAQRTARSSCARSGG
jgi:DNA processing protein